MRTHGIATPDWVEQDGFVSQHHNAEKYLIKSSWEHASIGLDENSLVHYTDQADILKEMKVREGRLGGSCYAEAYIEGREFNVALISDKSGAKVLPIAEMLFQDYAPDKLKIVDYKAKWNADSFEYNNTIRKFDVQDDDLPLISSLREISLQCWNIFSLSGYARCWFPYWHKRQTVGTGSQHQSLPVTGRRFAAALEQAGIKYHEAIGLIIDNALKKN